MRFDRRLMIGLGLALVSAATFGTSGSFARGLLDSGWSPVAAVATRVAVGGLVLLGPAIYLMRGRWHLLRRGWRSIVLFGALAVAACQVTYFLAVQRLDVAVALLLEYLGIILIVGWLWLRHGQRPRPLTIIGAAISMAGLALVLDVFGAISLDPIGVLWGLAAAVGLACYFIVAADESHGLPPLVLATGGLLVGAAGLGVIGLIGIVPMHASTADIVLAGRDVPWWVGICGLALLAAAIAYATGIAATRRLGSKLASFVGLSEVLFAVLFAWVLLGELPAPIQLAGGALILLGVIAVKADERPEELVEAGTSRGDDAVWEELDEIFDHAPSSVTILLADEDSPAAKDRENPVPAAGPST